LVKLFLLTEFLDQLKASSWLEWVAVITGIASVWFSRMENILVYPVGLVNTIIYTWLSFKADLFGEVSVNFYYTVMSFYGWFLWAKKDQRQEHIVHITFSDGRWWRYQLYFFAACYLLLFLVLTFLKQYFAPGAIPWADGFAAATAFTGMWLMTKKKVESWIWWIATDIASVPLYYYKHFSLTSVYYFILLIMAVFGLMEWRRKAGQQLSNA
jgi:nicotinamide mononucleotide transporter